MTNENVETMKADAKKMKADVENIMSHQRLMQRLMLRRERLDLGMMTNLGRRQLMQRLT